MMTNRFIFMLFILTLSATSLAGPSQPVIALQQRWAEVNYLLSGKTQLTAFEQLTEQADRLIDETSDNPELRIWRGIIKSTHAGARGGLGALKMVKSAKKDLETALDLDPTALDGSAYTSLGTLYYSVPGWPIGFGDDEKAEGLLQQALNLNPDGIDANYFYGDFLLKQHRYDEARRFLTRAQQAAPRPGREVADQGRQQEIRQRLMELEQQHPASR